MLGIKEPIYAESSACNVSRQMPTGSIADLYSFSICEKLPRFLNYIQLLKLEERELIIRDTPLVNSSLPVEILMCEFELMQSNKKDQI